MMSSRYMIHRSDFKPSQCSKRGPSGSPCWTPSADDITLSRGGSRIQERGVPKCARVSAQKFFQVPHPLLDTPTKYTIMKFCSAADVCVPKTMDISSYWISFDGYIKIWCSLYIYFILYLLTLKPFALPWAPHESVFSSTCLIL